MADYRQINAVYNEMYERFGGMMTLSDVATELGTSRAVAKRWAEENVPGTMIGERVKYETRLVAKSIVNKRGFC